MCVCWGGGFSGIVNLYNTYTVFMFRCLLANGSELVEGDFIRLKDSSVPQSSHVIFIIEAKQCNRDLTGNKSIPIFVSMLLKELQHVGLTDNR